MRNPTEKPERKRPFEVPARNILNVYYRIWGGGAEWINLAKCKVHWRALVKTLMKLRVQYKMKNFCTNKAPVTFLRTLLRGSKT
jgi:hypothetical protein